MRFKARQPAAPGERFAPGAFDNIIGGEVSFRQEGVRLRGSWFEGAWLPSMPQSGTARLVAADVAPDGSSVEFTFELVEDERP